MKRPTVPMGRNTRQRSVCRPAILCGLIAGLSLAGCVTTTSTAEIAASLPPVSAEAGALADSPSAVTSSAMPGTGRLLLPNATALPGENFLLSMPGTGLFGPYAVDELLRRLGSMPHPFEYVIARDFIPAGGLTTTLFVEDEPEPGITCVLAVRPADAGRTTATVMRNCVPGDRARALAPMSISAL